MSENASEFGIELASSADPVIPPALAEEAPILLNNQRSGAHVQVADVSYSIPKGNKQLLHRVSLVIKPGDMVALMGPSGAGKSTLLDLIANRKLEGEMSGQILINHRPWGQHFNRQSAYCLQDDMHFGILTVEETIRYAAWTRMPRGTTAAQMDERVNYLISIMGLSHVRKTIVGGPNLKGLSGGQIKRLSIAVEIVSLPDLIFLDEPTSGLDSGIALEVMQAVRTLADGGATVLATIHQPSNETFALFNKVAFLAAGKLVYFGPTSEVTAYFTGPQLGYRLPVHATATSVEMLNSETSEKDVANQQASAPGSQYFSISDYVLEICSGKDVPAGPADGPAVQYNVDDLAQVYLRSATNQEIQREIEESRKVTETLPMETATDRNEDGSTLWTQFSMCMHRCVMTALKDTRLLTYLMFSNIAMGLLVGIVFVGQGILPSEPLFPGGFASTQLINFTTMLSCLTYYPFILSQAIMHSLAHKIILYDREMRAGAFSPFSVWLAEVMLPIGFIFVLNWLFFIPAYFLIQLPVTASSFFFVFFIVYFIRLVTYYLLVFLMAWSKDENIAMLGYLSVSLFLEYIFNGITILIRTLPIFWIFAPYIAYQRYAIQGCMQFYFTNYATDDDSAYTTGNGNVLAFYSYNIMPQNLNFLVLFAFMVFHSVCGLYFMQLPTSRLKIVPSDKIGADNNASVPSASDGAVSNAPNRIVAASASITTQPISLYSNSSVRSNGIHVNHQSQASRGGEAQLTSRPSLMVSASERVASFMSGHRTSSIRRKSRGSSSLQQFHLSAVSVRVHRVRSESIDDLDVAVDDEPSPPLTVEFYRQQSSLVQPARGCMLAFRDIHYHAKNGVHILKGVSGIVKPGEMCALLGASGAGKSTLLDVLAGRKRSGISGEILFNKSPRTPEITKASAYVMQDNVHFAKLTVRESIYFSAELRLSETMPRQEKDARIQQIIDMLGLSRVSESLVGSSSIRGISGGQLKRLSIGVEIVHLPDLIYLDEPTTGLDGTTALEVISAVRNLANQHRTVLFTIHSPSVEVGKLFDNLLLMQAGRIAYFGPSVEASTYFMQSPFQLPITFAADKNPFEDYIAIVSTKELKLKNDQNSAGEVTTSITDYYSESELCQRNKHLLETSIGQLPFTQSADTKYVSRGNQGTGYNALTTLNQDFCITSTWHQVKTLLHRSGLLWIQNPTTMVGYYLAPIGFAIFYGWVYYQAGSVGTYSESDVTYNMIFLLWLAPNAIYYMQQFWVADAIDSRLIFYRERGASACGIVAFWMSLWVVPTIYLMTSILPYCAIFFYMTSIATVGQGGIFAWFFLIVLLVGLLSLYAMLSIAAASPTVEVAHTILPLWLAFSDLFGGIVVVVTSFPNWLYYWAPFIDFSRWSYQGLMVNEFLTNSVFASSGQSTIDSFGFNTYDKETCAWILMGFTLGYLALMFLFMNVLDFEEH